MTVESHRAAPRRRRTALVVVGLALSTVLAGGVRVLGLRDDGPGAPASPPPETGAALVARGAYLARAGNCAGCHTDRGGAPYAGGTAIPTPFGTVHASNLTPDPATGIGAWSAEDFWRALHDGRSRDGRLLYPAFPYPDYTRVRRDDADALFAYLRSLPPVVRPNTPHALRWPYRLQTAVAVWRLLFFRPGVQVDDAARPADWNRGRYLVRGLGHCASCHAARNAWGASDDPDALGGGLMPVQNWYAPALDAAEEAGVAGAPLEDVVELLKTGRSPRGSVAGPMADVVYRSTQHLSESDLRAIAVYLDTLPMRPATRVATPPPGDAAASARGESVYRGRCAQCHGEQGQGAAGAYPALAGNRSVTMASPANLVKRVIEGGYLPATAGNPRPYGMPPFGPVLDDVDVAAVVTYVRGAWGNRAAPVSALDVLRLR